MSFDVHAAVFNGSPAGLGMIAVTLMVFVGHFEGPEATVFLFHEVPPVTGVLRAKDDVKGSGFDDVEVSAVDGPKIF